jgi:aminoglycoside 2'-N-acetyltransferase I
MKDLRIAHTSDVPADMLNAARCLLDDVFEGAFTDQDWEHSLGGMHALMWEQSELIGHAAVVQRRLLHRERAVRTGYVEGVGVRADRRRRGHAAAMMSALERVIRGGYELGALSAADGAASFYAGRGWRQWQGPTFALTPTGTVRTATEDGESSYAR